MQKLIVRIATGAALAMGAVTANAAILDAPVPTNAYISYLGLDWAWASPLDQSSVDLSYQAQFGWRLPTVEELANAPTALMFIFDGANVPLGGADPVSGANFQYTSSTLDGAAALAAPYFNSTYYHGDWCNAPGSACGFGEVPWNTGNGFNESLVVRSAVPEAATWVMLIAGFGLVGAAARRRVAATA